MEERNYKVEFWLCLFGGFLGLHKFYEKKYGKGILYLFTMGLFIFGWIIDSFRLFKYAFIYDSEQIEEKKVIKDIKREKKKALNKEKYEQFLQEKREDQERIRTMKRQGTAFCPKCHGTSITAQNKKLSLGRAAVGGVLLGGAGAVMGGLSSKKIVKICLNCGHKWK